MTSEQPDPALLQGLVARASRPDFGRFQAQLRSSGHCARPIRLRGYVQTRDGRRKAIHDYVGPARDPEAGRKAIEALEAYTRKAIEEARRRLQSEKVEAMAGTR